jgi:hypothetical protein
LSHYPEGLYKKAEYVLMWIVIFTGIEYKFYLLGSVVCYKSWTIGWSGVHNTYQFILLRIHYKNPLFAWVSAFAVLIVMMKLFGIPLEY